VTTGQAISGLNSHWQLANSEFLHNGTTASVGV